uniref:Uncharacterized protein n=1 Tax=Thermogemmatispora argillosa TaxID=2045280 RepID=A0A455SUP5_9CHLR|nr:hypothetical protein KTA_02960 [Thermogemmatispora argillosa]
MFDEQGTSSIACSCQEYQPCSQQLLPIVPHIQTQQQDDASHACEQPDQAQLPNPFTPIDAESAQDDQERFSGDQQACQ